MLRERQITELRAGYERMNRALRGEEDLLTAIRALYVPEIVFELGPLEGTYHGHDAVARVFESQRDIIRGLRFEPKEFVDAGPGAVVVTVVLRGRAHHTDLPVEIEFAHLWRGRREGKATYLRVYDNKEAALRAVEHDR